VELLGGALLVDASHMGAGDGVCAPRRQQDVGPGGGGVHRAGGGIVPALSAVIGGPILVAFVDLIEEHRRGHGAGDVHPVQNQGDHRLRVGFGGVPQVHENLSLGEHAAEAVGPRPGDGDHGMGPGLGGGVLFLLGPLAVGGIGAVVVVDNLAAHIDGPAGLGGRGGPVHVHPAVGEDDFRLSGPGGKGGIRRTRQQGSAEKQGKNLFVHESCTPFQSSGTSIAPRKLER